jgi:hypothetical protein
MDHQAAEVVRIERAGLQLFNRTHHGDLLGDRLTVRSHDINFRITGVSPVTADHTCAFG